MTRTYRQFKGDAGEAFIRQRYLSQGYDCTPIKYNNRGFDFIAERINEEDEVERIYVEVKAGSHDMSAAQWEMKDQVERDGYFYNLERITVPGIYYNEIMRNLWPNGY